MKVAFPFVAVSGLFALAVLLVEYSQAHWLIGVLVPYLAIALFLFGMVYRVVKWARSPVPFRIPTTCGQGKSLPWIKQNKLDNPSTLLGVVGRMLLEVLFFRSLFRNTKTELKEGSKVVYGSNKWLWLGGLVFHYTFLVIFLRHLRFFTEPVPGFVKFLESLDGFFQVGVPALFLSSFLFLAAVSYLFIRRILSPQLRYLSLANDYFPLFLLLGIGCTGVLLRHFFKTDIVSVKELGLGLLSFQPVASAEIHSLFYGHLFLVCLLVGYFPFSKLVHAAGIFMSPTRNLANNNRMVRHVNPWDHPVKVHTYEEYEDDFRDKMKAAGIPVDKE